jgi:hypothetical protein
VGVGQRALSFSAHTAGGPPPSWPWGGWRHHAIFLEFSWFYCGVAATGNGWFLTIRERASTPPFTQEVLVAGALSAAPFASGVGGMDHGAWRWRRTCTSSPPNMPQRSFANTREHQLRPGGLATVIRQVSAFLKPETGLYGRLA